MANINIFQDEAFSVPNLTAAINETPYVPGRIGALGLFSEEGIPTLVAQIEYDGQTIGLVAAKPRGSYGAPVLLAGRRTIPLNTVHLPQRSAMMADEIQGIRAFGSQTELEVAEARVQKYLAKHRMQLDMTHENHRLGAIKGKVLDADGTTVLLDVYQTFGITQKEFNMELGTAGTIVRTKCSEVVDMIADALGGVPMPGARALCGKSFWSSLIDHKSVRETYLNTQQAAELRGKAPDSFEIGGIIFERYRGRIAGQPHVDDDEAYAFPENVPNMFLTRFAPADYLETVNTDGLPYYSRVEPLPMGKGLDIESQSNPLHAPAIPKAIIKLKRA
ncbi:major capsid protein [Alcaligenes sp. PF14]|uniref:major capsid protein n=1 Tax=Alcaligenes sp. PF14 TaxID=3120297 RepID=UPI003019A49F